MEFILQKNFEITNNNDGVDMSRVSKYFNKYEPQGSKSFLLECSILDIMNYRFKNINQPLEVTATALTSKDMVIYTYL